MACRQKQEGPEDRLSCEKKTEQQIFASHSSKKKPRVGIANSACFENTDFAETYYYTFEYVEYSNGDNLSTYRISSGPS